MFGGEKVKRRWEGFFLQLSETDDLHLKRDARFSVVVDLGIISLLLNTTII